MAKNSLKRKYKTLTEAYTQANQGDEMSQRIIIGTLSNLGCDHLAKNQPGKSKWMRHWLGLQTYIESLVGEYGMKEHKAEKEVLAEVNNAWSYSAGIELEDKPVDRLKHNVTGAIQRGEAEAITEVPAFPTVKGELSTEEVSASFSELMQK